MPQTTLARGNELYDFMLAPTITWSSATIAGNTTSELTATIGGLQVGDYCDAFLSNGAMTTGLQISNMRASAANTLAVTWVNSTGGSLTVPVGPWLMNVVRAESFATLPTTAA